MYNSNVSGWKYEFEENDAFARGNNNANVFKVGGAKVAVENSVIKASLFAGT